MLTFFRRIRKGLLDGGKTRRYLVYAIGEVLLVMVGILLALQVNNWNLKRLDSRTEKAVCSNLHTSLSSDLSNLEDCLLKVNTGISSQEIIMNHSYEELLDTYSLPEIQRILNDLGAVSISFFPNYGLYNQITSNNQIQLIQITMNL